MHEATTWIHGLTIPMPSLVIFDIQPSNGRMHMSAAFTRGGGGVAGIGKKCGKMRENCGKCGKKCERKCGFVRMVYAP